MLEGFIEGQQVSVDGIVCGDEVSTFGVIEIERMRHDTYFLELASQMPTSLGAAREKEIEAVAARAAKAVGLRCGGFHCELKVTDRKITVIEIAGRRGADNVSDFIRFGIDVYEEGVRLACGERRVYLDLQPEGVLAMRYFLPEEGGILESIEGIEEIMSDPRVREAVVEVAPGDPVLVPPDGYEFLGYLSVRETDRKGALAALDDLYDRVRFRVAAHEPVGSGR